MRANYTDYMKLWNRLYCGVALTEKTLSDNALNISNYLRQGGAAKIMNDVGVGLRFTYRDNVPVVCEMVYTAGEDKGRALTIREIENIGRLLLYRWKEIS